MDTPVNQVLTVLEKIEKANPVDLIEGLNTIFKQIVKMDKNQAIVAWQTLDFCTTRFPSESEHYASIKKLQEAIFNRMRTIARNDCFRGEDFGDVTGKDFSVSSLMK